MSNQSQPQIDNENPYSYAFSYLTSYITLQYANYVFAPYHIEIAKKLMLIEQGIIDRLIISTPPRHGKTMLVSEFFPAWYLGRNPSHQIIASTYSYERSTDVGRKVRNQLLTDIFKNTFKGFTLSSDSKSINRLSSDEGGNYFSVGVGGAITGRGADCFLIDDPIKSREDAESEINRRKLIEWYKSVAYTRLLPGGRIVVISTRWHYDDLTGYLLDEDPDKWTVLTLPAIAEHDEKSSDGRIIRKKGEALWPERYPKSKLKKIKEVIGSREWNSLYQQEPINEEGGIVRLSWFQRYDEREILQFRMTSEVTDDNPSEAPFGIIKVAISWDTAFKESEISTPSCATIWGISKTGYYLIHIFNEQVNFPKLKKKVLYYYDLFNKSWPGSVAILIEDKASGQSLIQVIESETTIPIIKINPELSKIIRMESVTHVIESGRVFIPNNAPWLSLFERQITQFPLGKYKDIVDSTSQFLKWVSRPRARKKRLKFWK